jgi:hypothetical protein
MPVQPVFKAPIHADETPAQEPDPARTTDLIEVDKALESMRDAGFDLTAAIGEPIDNSIEAGAHLVRVAPAFSNGKKSITAIAIADNGRGIPLTTMPHVLRMGYSTRYGERKGLGRFGVGLKLAGLSVARRIEVYTKPAGSDSVYMSFLDLDMIKKKTQCHIEAVEADDWPDDFKHLMSGPDGTPFPHGTLIIWRSIDRLSSGGTYGTALSERMDEVRKFIARAYRKFLDAGISIECDGKMITLHDPLFLMDNPRIKARYGDLRGRTIESHRFNVGGEEVTLTVTIVPETFRPREGAGGEKDADGKDIREFQISQENSGRLSLLRNGREIYYDIVPKILPSGVDKIDRYVGIEVAFPAELDEFFQVRHVKRGAEPVSKLRDELRKYLKRPVDQARKEIRAYWGTVKDTERQTAPAHGPATDVVERAERELPQGQAGLGITPEEAEQVVQDLLEDLAINPEAEPEEADRIRASIEQNRITIVDASWPGKELIDITHLNARAVVRLNQRHPFIREIYDPVKKIADNGVEDLSDGDIVDLARKIETALDILIMAYAKAENLHNDPSIFDNLRAYWGQHAHAYMREIIARSE